MPMETVLPSAQVFFHQNHSYCTLKKSGRRMLVPGRLFFCTVFVMVPIFRLSCKKHGFFEKCGIIYTEAEKADLKERCITYSMP